MLASHKSSYWQNIVASKASEENSFQLCSPGRYIIRKQKEGDWELRAKQAHTLHMGKEEESVIGQVDTHHLSSSASRPHFPCPTSPALSLHPGQHSPGGVGATPKPCLVAHTVEEPIRPMNPNCHFSDENSEVQGGGATVLRLHSQLSLELSCSHFITLFCLPARPTSTSHSGAHPARSEAWLELGGGSWCRWEKFSLWSQIDQSSLPGSAPPTAWPWATYLSPAPSSMKWVWG